MKRDTSAFNSAISDRTKELRIEMFGKRGRSKLAKLLGISPSTYHYYERGRVLPADLIVEVCDLAGVNLEWFLVGTGAKSTGKKKVSKAKAAPKKKAARRK